jgi:hypothetical protein
MFIAARLFMACLTFLMLTITIMQREDPDGYQATHLFFMPRQNWEMDLGREMLFKEEYYRNVDLDALAEEMFGRPASELVNTSNERDEQAALREYIVEHDSTLTSTHPQSPALHKPSYTSLAGNQLPTLYTLAAIAPDSIEGFAIDQPLMRPSIWQGDTPTPPPRNSASV